MIPEDYAERVYAGVLGKMIGVYLGRPFEGWLYEQIMAELGEINGYVHEQLGQPLIVTDDDLTGTFTFLRALTDHGGTLALTPEQIGQSWLNYIIKNRTILWWGGVGHSTEHTAFTRLQAGIVAPRSGAVETNGRIIAEQIGSQIFIDGWGMVSPGDPELAADLARRAASVSHDGEGIYGAQVVAAMVAQAFVESDLRVLLETAVSLIPQDSTVYRLIADVREWHASEPDWRVARTQLAANYGNDDLRRSLMIANTSGWDTDCNSGNVGCLLGIKNGLAGIDTAPDLRQPLDDRLYLPTADGGRAITDAVQETYHVVNAGRKLQNLPPQLPKDGARFHFSLPGCVQNFRTQDEAVEVSNVSTENGRFLALSYQLTSDQPVFVGTDTFIPPDAMGMPGYELLASPTLYPGQTVTARLFTNSANQEAIQAGLYLRYYGADDALVLLYDFVYTILPGQTEEVAWKMPQLGCAPIAEIGVWVQSTAASSLESACAVSGTLYLDYLTWSGEPEVTWQKPSHQGTMWHRAWLDGVDHYFTGFPEMFRIASDSGHGLLMQGTRQWQNVLMQATITPHLVKRFGLAMRVQGLQRYYAFLLDQRGYIAVVCVYDGTECVLAEAGMAWDGERPLRLRLQMQNNELQGWVDDTCVITAVDPENKLTGGGIALVIEEGCICIDGVRVAPARKD